MKLDQIKKVAVIGAGIMGHGFAQIFAQKGYSVTLYDIDEKILKLRSPGSGQIWILHRFEWSGRKRKGGPGKNFHHHKLEEVAGKGGFCPGGGPGDPGPEERHFRQTGPSGPSPRHFGFQHFRLEHYRNGLRYPKAGKDDYHPRDQSSDHHSARGNRPRGETSDETAEICYRLLLKLGKRPVRVLKEVPGFLFNRLNWPFTVKPSTASKQGLPRPRISTMWSKQGMVSASPTWAPWKPATSGAWIPSTGWPRIYFPTLAPPVCPSGA